MTQLNILSVNTTTFAAGARVGYTRGKSGIDQVDLHYTKRPVSVHTSIMADYLVNVQVVWHTSTEQVLLQDLNG